MPDHEPLVTVVIAGSRRPSTLLDCLKSVAMQTYERKSVVFVDDNSPNDMHLVALTAMYRPAQPVKQEGPWRAWGQISNTKCLLNVIRIDQQGSMVARNWGMKLAWDDSDLFLFLDSDEVLAPTCVAKLVEQFKKSPQTTGAVYSDYELDLRDGNKSRVYSLPYSRQTLVQNEMSFPSLLISKPAVNQVGIFDYSLPMLGEYDMLLRLSEQFNIAHVPASLFTKLAWPPKEVAAAEIERFKAKTIERTGK